MPSAWIVKRKGKKGVTYRVLWREGGRRYSVSCGTSKKRADIFLVKKKDELYSGKLSIPGLTKRTFRDYSKEYLEWAAQHKAPGTVRNFDSKAVGSFSEQFGNIPMQSITPHHIERWKSDLHKSGLGRTTISMRLRSLRAAFSHAVKMRIIQANPCAGIRQPDSMPRARVLSADELKRLFSAMPPRMAQAGVFILHTGVRLGECLSLDWKSINRPQDGPWTAKVESYGTFRTKTRRDRVIPLHPAAVAAMGRPRASGLVFEGLKAGMMEQGIRRARIQAGIKYARWHDLRHTFGTRHAEASGDIWATMRILGHSTLAATEKYQHLTKTRLDSALGLDFGFQRPIFPLKRKAPKGYKYALGPSHRRD